MKYFGTDGIRGKANYDLTIEIALKAGQALNLLNNPNVIIGYDTRVSSPMLMQALVSGALSKGLNVKVAKVISTPGLIYNSYINQSIGVMITASHNPYMDNGIKVVNNGIKLTKEEEILLENYLNTPSSLKHNEVGNFITSDECVKIYLDFLKSFICNHCFKIAIDTANGATYQIAKEIFKNALFIGDEPDGYNINHEVGSMHLHNITKVVKENKCDFGFAFDGDGDRIIVVDHNGIKYDGDKLIFILAKYFKKQNILNKDTVVLSIMSNPGLIKSFTNLGIKVITTPVGDKYIQEKIDSENFSLGGENSGHIITSYFKTGDAVLIGLLLIKVLAETNLSLYELTKEIEMYPDKMVCIKTTNKEIVNNQKLQERYLEISKIFGDSGKVILRASGTEDIIRVSIIAKDIEMQEKYINELTKMITDLNGGI